MGAIIDLDEWRQQRIVELEGVVIRDRMSVCAHTNKATFHYPTHTASRCLDCGFCWENFKPLPAPEVLG